MACLSRGALHAGALNKNIAIKNMMCCEILLDTVVKFDGVNNELVIARKDNEYCLIFANKKPSFYY
jgi:hypothetical protein